MPQNIGPTVVVPIAVLPPVILAETKSAGPTEISIATPVSSEQDDADASGLSDMAVVGQCVGDKRKREHVEDAEWRASEAEILVAASPAHYTISFGSSTPNPATALQPSAGGRTGGSGYGKAPRAHEVHIGAGVMGQTYGGRCGT